MADADFANPTQESIWKVTRQLKKEQCSLYNCVASILSDAAFVSEIRGLYPSLPLLANLRCGLWYTRQADGTCYFKSTDGHNGNWSFSCTRLNWHLCELAAKQGGVIVVDATRKGKRFPDAMTKTIPIWAVVINRAVARKRAEAAERRRSEAAAAAAAPAPQPQAQQHPQQHTHHAHDGTPESSAVSALPIGIERCISGLRNGCGGLAGGPEADACPRVGSLSQWLSSPEVVAAADWEAARACVLRACSLRSLSAPDPVLDCGQQPEVPPGCGSEATKAPAAEQPGTDACAVVAASGEAGEHLGQPPEPQSRTQEGTEASEGEGGVMAAAMSCRAAAAAAAAVAAVAVAVVGCGSCCRADDDGATSAAAHVGPAPMAATATVAVNGTATAAAAKAAAEAADNGGEREAPADAARTVGADVDLAAASASHVSCSPEESWPRGSLFGNLVDCIAEGEEEEDGEQEEGEQTGEGQRLRQQRLCGIRRHRRISRTRLDSDPDAEGAGNVDAGTTASRFVSPRDSCASSFSTSSSCASLCFSNSSGSLAAHECNCCNGEAAAAASTFAAFCAFQECNSSSSIAGSIAGGGSSIAGGGSSIAGGGSSIAGGGSSIAGGGSSIAGGGSSIAGGGSSIAGDGDGDSPAPIEPGRCCRGGASSTRCGSANTLREGSRPFSSERRDSDSSTTDPVQSDTFMGSRPCYFAGFGSGCSSTSDGGDSHGNGGSHGTGRRCGSSGGGGGAAGVPEEAAEGRGGDGWDVRLHLPLWISANERAQIERRLDGWVDALLNVGADVEGLAKILDKPLRPLWISQSSTIWVDQVAQPDQLPFTPLYLVSASMPHSYVRQAACVGPYDTDGGGGRDADADSGSDGDAGGGDGGSGGGSDCLSRTRHHHQHRNLHHCRRHHQRPQQQPHSWTYVYVPGAGDDEESWAAGLTPAVLWAHYTRLLQAGPAGVHDVVRELLQEEAAALAAHGSNSSIFAAPVTHGSLSGPDRASGGGAAALAAAYAAATDDHHLLPAGCRTVDAADAAPGAGPGGMYFLGATGIALGDLTAGATPDCWRHVGAVLSCGTNQHPSMLEEPQWPHRSRRGGAHWASLDGREAGSASDAGVEEGRVVSGALTVPLSGGHSATAPVEGSGGGGCGRWECDGPLALVGEPCSPSLPQQPPGQEQEDDSGFTFRPSLAGHDHCQRGHHSHAHAHAARYLHLPVQHFKHSRTSLGQQLEPALRFLSYHLSRGRTVLIHDTNGLDTCVCVAVALLLACYSPGGSEAEGGAPQWVQPYHCLYGAGVGVGHVSKDAVRQRLAYVSAHYPPARPTRGMLRQVFNHFMQEKGEGAAAARDGFGVGREAEVDN